MHKLLSTLAILFLISPVGSVSAQQSLVKVTSLGSHAGDFCRYDRAFLFEDPDGTRILYDVGRTVAGAGDERLGNIDIVLVSHMHGDHVGDKHLSNVGAGSCAKPEFTVDATNLTNSVKIAVDKNAKIITGSEMPKFFAKKLEAAGGNPKNSLLVRFGGSRQVNGVTLTTVPAAHSNGVSGRFVGGKLGELLDAVGLTAYAGPPTGYVITFSNGLVAYLSGDTGITAEQKSVVADHYQARLAVINIGNTFTTGPKEAAYVVNELIKPASVIPSHANEQATESGKLIAGTRTDEFIKNAKIPVLLPLSGKTMSFDSAGECVSGCSQ
ncbi:MAG: MBL fold metallo-hydrolase [Gammaproteobacteria bacterium]|nr:MBL fold metallo-hydrolase [Gammaproteobacteria bacterium]